MTTEAESASSPVSEATNQSNLGLGLGVAQLLASRSIAMTLQFVSLALIARALGPTQYGLLQFAIALFVYVGLTNDMGLTLLGARGSAQLGVSVQALSALLGARLLLTMPSVLAICTILVFKPMSAETAVVVVLLTVGFIASCLNLRWLMQARERFAAIAAADTIGAAVQLAVTVVLVRGANDVGWATVSIIALSISSTAVLARTSGVGRSLVPRLSSLSVRLTRQAAPLGIALLATAVYYSADSVMIGVFRGNTDVGLYSASYRIVLACLTIPVVVHSALLPVVSRLERHHPSETRRTLEAASRALIWLALPLTLGTALTSGTLVEEVFGREYAASAFPLALLMSSCLTVSANVPFAVLMLARRQDRRYMSITIIGAITNVALNLVAIPGFGIRGAAVTTIVTEVVVLGAIVWSTRDLSINILAKSVRRSVPPTATMGLAIFFVRDHIVAVPIGVLVYLVASLVTRAYTASELRQLTRVLAPLRS